MEAGKPMTPAGYTSPSLLDQDLTIGENEAVQILKVASETNELDEIYNGNVDGAQTAWDMLREEESCKRITTSCSDLDAILGGRIRCKQLTEIGGVPGIGKTQLGIQLAVNVQIPADYGGHGGKAIYIDTQGSFMVERALQIPEACAEDMLEYNSFLRRDSQVLQVNKRAKDFLNDIFYIRPCSYTEQIDVISYLEKLIMEHKDVKVVIIDSIASTSDRNLRTWLLGLDYSVELP